MLLLLWIRAPALACFLLISDRQAEDAGEAENLGKAQNLFDLLHLISRNDNLISRHEIGTVRSFPLVDLGDIHRDLRKHAARLASQHDDLALVAGAQHTAGFGNRFSYGHAMVHQTDARLAHVAHDAVAIRRSLVEGHGNLWIDNVFVVTLLDELTHLVNGLAVYENSAGY